MNFDLVLTIERAIEQLGWEIRFFDQRPNAAAAGTAVALLMFVVPITLQRDHHHHHHHQ